MRRLALIALALALAACSKSSPTEPDLSASLSGYVRVSGYDRGTLTIRDSAMNSHAVTLAPTSGDFAFGNVFVAGPYDAYLDKTGMPQRHVAMHGQDSQSPPLKPGPNTLFWVGFGLTR